MDIKANRLRGRYHSSEADAVPTVGALFPLTPALSHWERENRRPPPRASGALRRLTARREQPKHRNVRGCRERFPLPEGEGQGEGERDVARRQTVEFRQ